MKHLVLFYMSILPFMSVHGANVIWDGEGDGINWSDANNWDCNCLPIEGDNAEIPHIYSTITVQINISVNVDNIHAYASIEVSGGAQINVLHQFRLINGSDLSVQPGVIINAEDLVFISVSDPSGQVWNADCTNYGTINSGAINMYEYCDPSYPCYTLLTNNGTINTSDLGIIFEHHTQVINNNSMTLNGYLGIQMSFTNAAQFTNNGNFNSNTYNFFKNTTNSATGVMTINNYNNSVHPITYDYTSPIEILDNFSNLGAIIMSNPQAGAYYGIQVLPTATFTSSGTLSITSHRHPIRNEGTTTISGTSYLHATESVYQAGIENVSNFNLNDASTTFTCTSNFRNLTGGVLNIESCKSVNLLSLYNQGTTTNQGTITFDPTNTSSVSLTQIGTFSNEGIMINCAFPVILPPAENQGLFVQRIMGTQCSNITIASFISGLKINITNGPTVGIFADAALTTSAGNYNWVLDEFTPNIACVNLDILYIQIQKTGCAPLVVPIRFQYPIKSDIWYADVDGDGWGNTALTTSYCGNFLIGYTQNIPDCNDNDAQVYPGAPENCNDKDYNCDGITNGALSPPSTWYQDSDFDGFGNPAITLINCAAPAGYVSNNIDCNDNDFQIHPGASELCDNLDNNCNGLVDEGIPMGTSTFTNGGMNSLWSNPANWMPPTIPQACFNVVIPSGLTVNANVGVPIECRSITVLSGATLNINGANVTVSGSASAGIINSGTVNIAPNSNITISNTLGHGIDNYNTVNTSVGIPSILSFNNIGQNAFQNNNSGIVNCFGPLYVTSIGIGNRAISNNGNFTFRGLWGGINVQGYFVFNSAVFNNYGSVDIQNGFNLPQWVIFNTGTFFNRNLPPDIGFINLPTPSVPANVSDQGIWNAGGATLHNYGNIQVFGNRIAGEGMLINHAGATFIGSLY
ncbi:MAG: putative metal-binding motif-containing protein [Saprospiraceae bacterium]